jgi:hypothetical protein
MRNIAASSSSNNQPLNAIQAWDNVSEIFKGKAIFAYMVDEVPDIIEYFNIDLKSDLPIIVAHDPSIDFKYRSEKLNKLTSETLGEFVAV